MRYTLIRNQIVDHETLTARELLVESKSAPEGWKYLSISFTEPKPFQELVGADAGPYSVMVLDCLYTPVLVGSWLLLACDREGFPGDFLIYKISPDWTMLAYNRYHEEDLRARLEILELLSQDPHRSVVKDQFENYLKRWKVWAAEPD